MKQNQMKISFKTIFGPYVMNSITGVEEKEQETKLKEIYEVIDDYVEQA